jgi:hypothetical protein
MSTAERIAWGLLSLIVLIALLRWLGTPEDQQKLKPPQVPKEKERRWERADQSVGSERASISLARSERWSARSRREAKSSPEMSLTAIAESLGCSNGSASIAAFILTGRRSATFPKPLNIAKLPELLWR